MSLGEEPHKQLAWLGCKHSLKYFCGRASYQSSLVSFFLSKFAPTLLGFLFAFFILSAKNNVNYYTVKEYYSVIKRTVSRSWSHHLAASSYLTAHVGNNTSFTFSSWSAKPACGVKLLSYCFCQMHEKNENKAALTVFLEFFKWRPYAFLPLILLAVVLKIFRIAFF